MKISDEMVEAGCKAHADMVYAGASNPRRWPDDFSPGDQATLRSCMQSALEAVAPMIRAEAREESAVRIKELEGEIAGLNLEVEVLNDAAMERGNW
jgi:hypothetical protein